MERRENHEGLERGRKIVDYESKAEAMKKTGISHAALGETPIFESPSEQRQRT
jgi:hypothetical protein